MKLKNRFKKTLVTALAASMVSSLVSVPVAAGEVKTVNKNVTFTVSAGDLLIATNPVPYSVIEDGKWDTHEEDLGTVDLVTPSSAVRESGFEDMFKMTGAGQEVHCATIEKNEKYNAWKKKHPGSSEIKGEVKSDDYEVGDLMWHGYDRDYGLGADVIMKGAPVYEGNADAGKAENYTGEDQPQEPGQRDNSKPDQVYRRYRCMAVEKDFTLWCYVARSETTDEPGEADIMTKEEEGKPVPVYLSQSRADMIKKELVSMNFMKKVTDAAGDFSKCDAKGDNDKKVAIMIEPINDDTLGFVWGADRESSDGYFKPVTSLDCLHVQAQCTLGTKLDGETWTYDETTGVPPYATMAHELTHYIVDGYCDTADGWINEWFAQAVMVDVIHWDGSGAADKTVSDDIAGIGQDVRENGLLRNYAGPTDPEDSLTYPISTLMAGYFTGRMGGDLWKDVITNNCMTEQALSEFLEKREGGLGMGLQWWLGSFNLAVMGQVRGPETWGGEDDEFLLNPFGEDDREKDTIGGTHTAIADFVRNDLQESVERQQTDGKDEKEEEIISSLSVLSKELLIPGGGTTSVFEVEKDYIPEEGTLDITIKGVGEDVIWARKDGAGMIDMGSTSYEEEEPETASRDADGNWTYTTEQKQALEQSMRLFGETAIEGTDAKFVLKPFAKEAAFYTGNKKALTESLVDKDKSSVSINGVDLKIKKVTLKNIKKAYVSKESLFRSTISENNMEAYAAYNENKLPGYVLTIDTKGVTDPEIKKAAKKANKMLKKYPVLFDLLPVNLTSSNVTVTKYNDSKQVVKKLTVTDQDGNTNKLKKKDFSSEASGDQNVITGEINYNGQVLYDPVTGKAKAV